MISSENMPILSNIIALFKLFMIRWEDGRILFKTILIWRNMLNLALTGHICIMVTWITHIILIYKYIFLSYIIRLTIICSPQFYNTYNIDLQTMELKVYCNGQSKDLSNSKFIYIIINLFGIRCSSTIKKMVLIITTNHLSRQIMHS